MVERDAHYADPRLVALYDALNGWSPARDYYLALAHDRVRSAIDFGCGTGLLTARFAALGRRVVGVDPSPRMLEAARARDGAEGVEWRVGAVGAFEDGGRHDLAVMTGHAFQCLLTDAEIDAAFANVAKLLRPGGLFAFETRNPAARAWERWRPEPSRTTGELADGRRFEMRHDLLSVDGELVAFETVYEIEGESPISSRSTLRFAGADHLVAAAKAAGLTLRHAHGDWDGSPLSDRSPEIIFAFSR